MLLSASLRSLVRRAVPAPQPFGRRLISALPLSGSSTVQGLDDASIRKEQMDAVAAAGRDRGHFIFDSKGDGADKRKRKGAGDAGSGGAPLDAAKLRGMGYRHLQGLAKAQGLAATGSKKELLQRLLSACATAVAKDCDGEADEKAKKEKIVKATRRALQCWISTYLTI